MRAAVPDLRVGHTGALLSIDHVLVDDPDRPGARSGPCPALCFPTIDAAWEAVKAAEAALDRLAEIARGAR
ncbi:hypothetical protein [Phenylobacterium conjunctum]|uniref:Uncharacterized protein n=1 Tax=Phenylobacterium conjunctum TaxID=1298959 RepID=A0ABW3T0F2_9CAUL